MKPPQGYLSLLVVTILFLVFSIVSVKAESIRPYSCTDSDGGLNYNIQGKISGVNEEGREYSKEDYCVSDVNDPNVGILQEFSCTKDGISSGTGYTCPNGCLDGACVKLNSSRPSTYCTDSDGGLNYYLKGVVSGGITCGDNCGPNTENLEDYCTSYTGDNFRDNYVAESFCDSNNNVNRTFFKCPYGCSKGTCISEPPLVEQRAEKYVCVFNGAETQQKCYSDNGYACAGEKTYSGEAPFCKQSIQGDNGKKVVWKSSCGGIGRSNEGNDYTIIDGDDETVTFDCSKNTSHPLQCGKLIYFCSEDSPYCSLVKDKVNQFAQDSGCVEVTKHIIPKFMDLAKDPLALKYSINYVPDFVFVNNDGCFVKIGNGGGTKLEDIKNGIANFKCESNSSHPVTDIVKQKVKCVFMNSTDSQKCYSMDEERNSQYSCSSDQSTGDSTTCVVDDIEGKNGQKLIWKSSCGGYATTVLDGENKYAIFYCSKEEYTEVNSFNGASWSCYGQNNLNSTNGIYDSNSCRTSEEWMQYALDSCHGVCDSRTGKCGVNSFTVGEICGKTITINPELNSTVPVVITPGQENGTTVNCNGCLSDNKCYPMGYRKEGNYCSDNNEFIVQLTSEVQCDNNFQCSSNVCVANKCISPGLLDSFISWFKKLFGN